MNKRKLLIIVGLALTVILLLVIFLSNRSLLRKIPSQVPVFNPTPTETPNFSTKDLIVIHTDPTEDPLGKNSYSPIRQIILTFNKTINPQTLNVQVLPKIELKMSTNSAQLTIQPKPPLFWIPNTIYTIIIKEGLAAEDGSIMKDDYVYRIQAKLQGGE